MGLIPGQGTKIPHTAGRLSPHTETTEPECSRAHTPQPRPSTASTSLKKKKQKKKQKNNIYFLSICGVGGEDNADCQTERFPTSFFFFYFYKIKPEPQCPILASQSMGVDCGFCCGTWAAPVTGRTSHLQPHVPVAFASGPWWVGCCSRIWGQPGQNQASLMAQRVKSLPANAGDLGSIPGSGRFPGEGNGYPLQYSCLENPMDRGVYGLQFMG